MCPRAKTYYSCTAHTRISNVCLYNNSKSTSLVGICPTAFNIYAYPARTVKHLQNRWNVFIWIASRFCVIHTTQRIRIMCLMQLVPDTHLTFHRSVFVLFGGASKLTFVLLKVTFYTRSEPFIMHDIVLETLAVFTSMRRLSVMQSHIV